jgi:hypothetical protein
LVKIILRINWVMKQKTSKVIFALVKLLHETLRGTFET